LVLEEPALFSSHEMKVSSVKVSGSAPALPVAAGAAEEATGEELAAATWAAAEVATGAAEVAAGAELAGAVELPELEEPEPELAPENRAGPGIS
jgi:hypothetical protein